MHVPDRAVERVRHARFRPAATAAAQLAHHLDAGEVPVVELTAELGLQGAGTAGEADLPVDRDLHQHRLAEVADRVEDARMDRRAVRDGGVDGEPRAGAPARQRFRVGGEKQRRRGEPAGGGAALQRGPRRRVHTREVGAEPRVGDRRRACPQRQVGMRGEIVQPVQPVAAGAVRRGLVARGRQRRDIGLERRLRLGAGGGAAVAGGVRRPPRAEEQEHADGVHHQPVVADMEHHAVIGEHRDLDGEQRCPVGGQDTVRPLLAQGHPAVALRGIGLAAQVQPLDPHVGRGLLDLGAVRGDPGTQDAVPRHHGPQGRPSRSRSQAPSISWYTWLATLPISNSSPRPTR